MLRLCQNVGLLGIGFVKIGKASGEPFLRMYHLKKTPSLAHIILVTHPRAGDLREPLKYIYNLYVEYVVKNSPYTPGTPINTPYDTGKTAMYISRVAATTPSIIFHSLPTVTLPPNSSYGAVGQLFGLPRLNNPNVHQALQTISQTSSLKAFIIDFFCDAAFEVSTSLGIPTYYFYTSGAPGLSAFLYLTTLDNTTTGSIKDLKGYIEFTGTPSIFPTDLAEPLFDRHSTAYKRFIYTAAHMAKSSGIIANTFEALEPRAVKAISEGLCVPNAPTPPVYYVGPLIASNDQASDEQDCLSWLSSQPSQSVVFLSFGSMGLFKAEQLTEMAIGLENSDHRFLWVVRSPPPTDDQAKHPSAVPESNLDTLFVSAAELEKRVRELMDSSSGKAVRDRVREMRDGARAATQPNGSSRVALAELLKTIRAPVGPALRIDTTLTELMVVVRLAAAGNVPISAASACYIVAASLIPRLQFANLGRLRQWEWLDVIINYVRSLQNQIEVLCLILIRGFGLKA
ncbi:hypothetical protein RJ639_030141 [Escallonia herrerae]|uniref:Uncharacterized protein n=1 Tax=Escallonia herrerae TaxID=1293975 RepID=A0AA88WZN9_9ASTE|nr:hypothetical protein RJ639_030141 [Escallonia herrerae]